MTDLRKEMQNEDLDKEINELQILKESVTKENDAYAKKNFSKTDASTLKDEEEIRRISFELANCCQEFEIIAREKEELDAQKAV